MKQPARPDTVPADARWEEEEDAFEWIVGELDDSGERHNAYRFWTEQGALHAECTYVHGKLHGLLQNFHPDGTVASAGHWENGLLYNCDYFRPKVESPEPWPEQAEEKVEKVLYVSTDGKSNCTIRYFDGEGNPVGMDGEPLPPRPAGVPESARHHPEMEEWIEGAIERGTNNQIGPWKWWTTEGELAREKNDLSENEIQVLEYERGRIDSKTIFNKEGVRVRYESYFDNGNLFRVERKNDQNQEIFEACFDRDGALDTQIEMAWEGEEMVHRRERDARGRVMLEVNRAGDALRCVLFHGNGEPCAEGVMREDLLDGAWRFYDERGDLQYEQDVSELEIESGPSMEELPWSLDEALFELLEPEIPEVEVLAASKEIDWSEIEGCFGETEHFHRFLRGLVSDEPRVRRHALGGIYREVLHQGSVYDATAFVLPFVIDLLDHDRSDTESLLEMVFETARSAAPYVEEAKRDLEDPDDDDNDWARAILGTVEAINISWDKLWKLMERGDDSISQSVISLASIPPPTAERTEVLRDFARNNESDLLRACAIESISNLDGVTVDLLLPHLKDPSLLIRATTAIEIGLTFGPESPAEVVGVFEEILNKGQAIEEDYHALPFVDVHLLARFALAVGCVRTDAARKLTIPLCERLEDVDGMSATTFGQGLLATCFGKGERPFDPAFLQVLDTLAKSRSFNVFNANAAEVLGRWNLPSFAEELAPFVKELEAESDPELVLYERMQAVEEEEEEDGACEWDEEV